LKNLTMLLVTSHVAKTKCHSQSKMSRWTRSYPKEWENNCPTVAQLFGQNNICTFSSTFLTLFLRLVGKVLSTPIEYYLAPFLSLIMHPNGKLCGSITGFDFVTIEVIQLKKKSYLLQGLKLCQWLVPCFYA
jgi:hypothetical protein